MVTVTPPGTSEPIVLAESAFIASYLCDHWGGGGTLVPRRWRDGREGKVGGETEAWLRYQYLLYYAEGSFMPYLFLFLVMNSALLPLPPPHSPSLLSLPCAQHNTMEANVNRPPPSQPSRAPPSRG